MLCFCQPGERQRLGCGAGWGPLWTVPSGSGPAPPPPTATVRGQRAPRVTVGMTRGPPGWDRVCGGTANPSSVAASPLIPTNVVRPKPSPPPRLARGRLCRRTPAGDRGTRATWPAVEPWTWTHTRCLGFCPKRSGSELCDRACSRPLGARALSPTTRGGGDAGSSWGSGQFRRVRKGPTTAPDA